MHTQKSFIPIPRV